MSLLFRERPKLERANPTYAGYDALAQAVRSSRASHGVYVDADSAMRHDAVWSCITKKAQDVAMLPVDVVRYQGPARVNVTPAPQIIAAPSAYTDAMDWRYQVLVSWFSAGNAWGLVTQTTPDMRYPTRIELQRASDVRPMMDGGRLRLFVNGAEHQLWPVGDLWHKPAFTVPGQLLGLSPIAYHAISIGVGLAAEQFGSQFFTDGGHPTALLRPATDPGENGAKALKEKFLEVLRGNREPLVLPQSVIYEQIQVNPTDSQFIETMRYSVEQVCRIFDEDPTDHGSAGGGGNTYANRSDADLARYKRRQFWITKLQNALTAMLPAPQVVKLNTSAFLMMTAEERAAIHDKRLRNKTRTVNEVRDIEDEPRFDDAAYDEPGIPGGSTDPTPQIIQGGAK
jgi:HK97 family phage portal protein